MRHNDRLVRTTTKLQVWKVRAKQPRLKTTAEMLDGAGKKDTKDLDTTNMDRKKKRTIITLGIDNEKLLTPREIYVPV